MVQVWLVFVRLVYIHHVTRSGSLGVQSKYDNQPIYQSIEMLGLSDALFPKSRGPLSWNGAGAESIFAMPHFYTRLGTSESSTPPSPEGSGSVFVRVRIRVDQRTEYSFLSRLTSQGRFDSARFL